VNKIQQSPSLQRVIGSSPAPNTLNYTSSEATLQEFKPRNVETEQARFGTKDKGTSNGRIGRRFDGSNTYKILEWY